MPQPWIFIHGAGSTRRTWSRQHRLPLDSSFLELPGRPQVLADHLIASLAEWCLQQMSGPSVIVGHSMGGAVAQSMALMAPQSVAALVLVGTGPRLPVNPDLLHRLAADPQEAKANIARWSLARSFDPALYELNVKLLEDIPGDRILHEMSACSLFDIRTQLSQYHGPTFLVRGAEDRMTPESLSREFLAVWPAMPIYTIEHAGHLMMLENPDAFNQALLDIAHQLPDRS